MYHMTQCVRKKTEQMLDVNRCAAYKMGMLAAHGGGDSITYADVRRECAHDAARTTVADVRGLCARIGMAYDTAPIMHKWADSNTPLHKR